MGGAVSVEMAGDEVSTRVVRPGRDLLIVTFGNGVRMSLRAAHQLATEGIDCEVMDLQWLAPLPVEDLVARARVHGRALVVDETRSSGGVSEAVVSALVDSGYSGRILRVTSRDSFVPLGPAAASVLLAESDIVVAARAMLRPRQDSKLGPAVWQ